MKHPENPKYFLDRATGKPVIIADYTSLVPTDRSMDYVAQIDEMVANKIRYNRVWHFLPWSHENAIWPWSRSEIPGAPMGGNKIDMDTWNPEYWIRMRDALSKATAKGITSEILVFDRCGISPGASDRWEGNPWAQNNNINALGTPKADGDGAPAFYEIESRPRMRQYQEAYMRKLIDETAEFNVIYEIENEHWISDDPKWHQKNADFLRQHLDAKFPDKGRLISYSSLQRDEREVALGYPVIDIHNVHFGRDAENDISVLNDYVESRWANPKPVNVDEFANGLSNPGNLRKMGWTIVMSGGHFHIEDVNRDAKPFEMTMNLKDFVSLSGWEFIKARPNRAASSGGYCMIQEKVEYVCYFPSGGNKAILLADGEYHYRWWDPMNGGFSNWEPVSGGAAMATFGTPNPRDFVLQVKRMGPLPSPTPTVTPSPTPTPSSQCVPTPPPLTTINLKVHNRPWPGRAIVDSTPIICSFASSPHYGYCQTITNDPTRGCCPIRPEGDPLREVCEAERMGVDPADGRVGPSWSFQGQGEIRKRDNPYLLIVEGKGTVTACSNTMPPVCNSLFVDADAPN